MNSDSPKEMDREARFSDPEFWSRQWRSKLDAYRAAPPRLAAWLRSRYDASGTTLLECAAGSCSDSIDLAMSGYAVNACDFDEDTITSLSREEIPGLTLSIEDGFSMSFQDAAFDVVFHNGFWVCFDDNAQIEALLREQLRVTGRDAVAVVHNAANTTLVEDFAARGVDDSLYNIRFFGREEVCAIAQKVTGEAHHLSIAKFGGTADRLYSLGAKASFLKPLLLWMVPRLYRFQPWNRVERIVLTVRKQ